MNRRGVAWCGFFTSVAAGGMGLTTYLANKVGSTAENFLSKLTLANLTGSEAYVSLDGSSKVIRAWLDKIDFTTSLNGEEVLQMLMSLPNNVGDTVKNIAWFEGLQTLLLLANIAGSVYLYRQIQSVKETLTMETMRRAPDIVEYGSVNSSQGNGYVKVPR